MNKLNTLLKQQQSWGQILLAIGEWPMSRFDKMVSMCKSANRKIYVHCVYKNPEVIVFYGICKKIYPTIQKFHDDIIDDMFYTSTCLPAPYTFKMPEWAIADNEVRINLSYDNKLQVDDGISEITVRKLPKKYNKCYMNDESCYNLYTHYRKNRIRLH